MICDIDIEMEPLADRLTVSSCDYLREIHHQIKNNLQVVCSLLRLESRQSGKGFCKEALQRCEQRVQSMALLYDCIFRHSGSTRIPLADYVRSISTGAVRSLGRGGADLSLNFDLDPVQVGTRAGTSIGLIVHELVWERLRRIPSSPELQAELDMRVELKRQAPGVAIIISDNFSAFCEKEDSRSLSSQILRALVQQFDGSTSFETGSCRVALSNLGPIGHDA